jgi:hypothetical protein
MPLERTTAVFVGLIINAAVLVVLVRLIVPPPAEHNFWRMFGIALGVELVGLALQFGPMPVPWIVDGVLVGAFLYLLLVRFCGLTLRQAAIVSCLFFVARVLLALLFAFALAPISNLLMR